MLEKVKEYFEKEYAFCKRLMGSKSYKSINNAELVNRTIDSCLAVALFSLTIGVDFDEVNDLYEEYREKLINLLTK